MEKSLKIIKLESENFKRLRAVCIEPHDNMVVISGRNEQGKTSVLDAIWAALAGADAMKDTPQPIRKGEKAARVRVDMGDLVVSRAWTDKGTYLKVENAEGMEYKSPQALLDKFIGKLSFDPLAFSGMKPRDQRETLLGLVKIDLDLDEWARDRAAAYERRTILNRKVKEYEAQVAGMPAVPAGTPDTELSTAGVLEEQAAAQAHKQANDADRFEAAQERKGLQQWEKEISDRNNRINLLKEELKELEKSQTEHIKNFKSSRRTIEALEAKAAKLIDPDLTVFAAKLVEVEAINRHVRIKQQRYIKGQELKALKDEAEKANETLAAMDTQKSTSLHAATFPIDGLAFDDEGVTYKSIPFSQCSAAERLRVSLAMAMSLNPTIRVLRITDGSLLDSDNLNVIREMVKEKDYQLWIERVEDDAAVGVIIEDGMVKENN
jgi:DNA repair exonuclease SbcCD ATPase subunit